MRRVPWRRSVCIDRHVSNAVMCTSNRKRKREWVEGLATRLSCRHRHVGKIGLVLFVQAQRDRDHDSARKDASVSSWKRCTSMYRDRSKSAVVATELLPRRSQITLGGAPRTKLR
jgi:hypothetical protein